MFKEFLYSQLFVRPAYPTRSFKDETVIVTGANVGLGLEAARHIVRLGAARVILGVRNVPAGEEAKASIEASTGRSGVCEVWEVDLASYKSVLAFGDRVAQLPRLDAAILNAALATPTFQLVDGYERTIAVNVINTLFLGLLVLPTLKATRRSIPSSRPRLSFVVSETHGLVKFPEWKSERPLKILSDAVQANMDERYPLSKLLEILAVQELAARVRASEVIITMVNPGLCHSQLGREAGWGLWFMKLFLGRTTEIGSRTLVAGVSTDIEGHGSYMTDGHVSNTSLSSYVRSDEGSRAREKLWVEISAILDAQCPGVMQNV